MVRRLIVLAALAMTPACGEETPIAADAASISTATHPSSCNTVANTGCSAGQKCALRHPSETDAGVHTSYSIGCVPEGSLDVGAECTITAGRADECGPRAFCRFGRCHRLCNPGFICGDAPCFTFSDWLWLGTCPLPCTPGEFCEVVDGPGARLPD